MTELELTGKGRDLLGRRQPRKEFASDDFPVPEAPNTTICGQSSFFKIYFKI